MEESTWSSTALEQRLKATRKKHPRVTGSLAADHPSFSLHISLHVVRASSVSLAVPGRGLPRWARLSYGSGNSQVEETIFELISGTERAKNKESATHVSRLPAEEDCARPAASSVRLSAAAKADVGLFGWITQRSNLKWDLVFNLLPAAQIVEFCSFVFCLFQKPQRPGLLNFFRFLTSPCTSSSRPKIFPC